MRSIVNRTLVALVIALCIWPTVVLACDGDAAPGLMEHNRLVVRALLLLSLGFLTATVILYFTRHRKGLLVVIASLLLVVIHPAWIYGGGGGDCGASMAEGARNSAVLLALGVAYQITLWLAKRRT